MTGQGIPNMDTSFTKITVKPVHPTFGAEIEVPDWNNGNVDDETVEEIRRAGNKYGFVIFRNTGLDDKGHVDFSFKLGDLDNIRRFVTGDRKLRYAYYELFDAGNITDDGTVLDPDSTRAHHNKGNGIFHVDSSYNFRRASFSLLRAVELPPSGTGGHTEFADSRTAFAELSAALKKDLVANDYVACHSLAQSRKLGSPEFFADLDPTKMPMARHRLTQIHEGSGRATLYAGAHLHHIEGMSREDSDRLRDTLKEHMTQDKYRYTFEWEQPGDMVMWDNRSTMHRAMGGSFAGKYRRDLRRTTVHDDSAGAWGLNSREGGSAFAYAIGTKGLGSAETKPAAELRPEEKQELITAEVPIAATKPVPVLIAVAGEGVRAA